MRGTPGSGKSTYTRDILKVPNYLVYSADNFFVDPVFGTYDFDSKKIGEAHGWCFRKFVEDITNSNSVMNYDMVVDNTNIEPWEIAPYAQAALAYGYELEIITLDVPPVIAHPRNVHGVPLKTVERMYDRLHKAIKGFPHHWPHKIVVPS